MDGAGGQILVALLVTKEARDERIVGIRNAEPLRMIRQQVLK
jgi:hypothetical protein